MAETWIERQFFCWLSLALRAPFRLTLILHLPVWWGHHQSQRTEERVHTHSTLVICNEEKELILHGLVLFSDVLWTRFMLSSPQSCDGFPNPSSSDCDHIRVRVFKGAIRISPSGQVWDWVAASFAERHAFPPADPILPFLTHSFSLPRDYWCSCFPLSTSVHIILPSTTLLQLRRSIAQGFPNFAA